MHGEEGFAQVRRRFEVAEDVVEEEVWVRVGGVATLLGGADGRLAVVEDDDFVDAEDGAGAGDLACEGVFHVVGGTAGDDFRFCLTEGSLFRFLSDSFGHSIEATYFAIMLPGKAKLNVCVLPFVGLKTAEGRDVSTASDGPLLSPPFSLRFCELSV